MSIKKERYEIVSEIVNELTETMRKAIKEELDRNTKTCLNCYHWDGKLESCGKFFERPPPTVIVNACEYHDDDIPF